jgi:hypothetical protein
MIQRSGHTTSIVAADEKQTTTTLGTMTDPWMIFLYDLKAQATRDKHIQRLMKFLDHLEVKPSEATESISLRKPRQLILKFSALVKKST